MRSDLLKILARKEITKIPQRNSIDSYIRTILGQRNLAPVSGYCLPRFSGFEDSLELFTLPDILILCDNLCESEHVSDKRNTSSKIDIFTVGSTTRNKNFLEISFKTGRSKVSSRENFIISNKPVQ